MRFHQWIWVVAVIVSPLPQLRAEPPTDTERLIERIAFGSCVHQDRPQPIWASVAAARPDLFLAVGDNLYGDTRDMAVLRRKYERQFGNPDFARFRGQVPILAIWDDHDYGINDAGSEYPMKAASKALMLEYFGEPRNSPRHSRAGAYTASIQGPAGRRVQIILLDTRWFRDSLRHGRVATPDGEIPGYVPNPDTSKTLLGSAQWRWLEDRLRDPADVRILVSSIQVTSEEHPYEKWSNFPHERARLLGLLRSTGAYGRTVILSGDRHHGELSCKEGLCDLTSSGLSHGRSTPLREFNRHRVSHYDQGNHFGLVTLAWPEPGQNIPVRATLELRDAQGSPTPVSHVVELR